MALDVASYTGSQTRLLCEFEQWIEEHERELEDAVSNADEDKVPEGVDALTGEIVMTGRMTDTA